jgi:hypothetical protein
MQINADSRAEKCATIALEKKSKILAKTDLAYWRRRLRKQPNSANWFAEISARGVRRKLSLETPNKESAATRARDIYQLARAVGWDAVLQKYRPNLDLGKKKFDPHGGGNQEWVQRVDAVNSPMLRRKRFSSGSDHSFHLPRRIPSRKDQLRRASTHTCVRPEVCFPER